MAPKIRHCACRIIPLRSSWPAALTPSLGPRPSHCPVKSFKSASEREGGELKAVRRLG